MAEALRAANFRFLYREAEGVIDARDLGAREPAAGRDRARADSRSPWRSRPISRAILRREAFIDREASSRRMSISSSTRSR